MKLLAPAATAFAAVTALSLFSTPSAQAAHPVEPAAPCLPGQPPAGHPRDDSGHGTELSTSVQTAVQAGEQTLGRGGPAATTTSFRAAAAAESTTTVRVYAHVLRTAKGGGISDHRVRRQVSILNQAYAGKQSGGSARSPFSFRLVQIDRTTNANWYRMDQGTVAEAHAKQALHRGNADDLNLYIGMNESGSLGWATQPGSYDRGPKLDGVVIRRTTMAGGSPGTTAGATWRCTRPDTGSGCSTRSPVAAACAATSSRTHPGRLVRRTRARSVATPAPHLDATRCATSWTTPTTVV